ncbi:hypothetical protein GCM10023156_00270 [Novipirellula rosea]|uniref:Uncharacterized protein n=2 Tax=Novipirellula rosea TaxID=1031540 RepID=A0ABP8M3Q8_9BACT
MYGLEEQVVFPDGLEEVARKYLDSLLKGDRQSLAKLLDETMAEQKCNLLTQALKDLRKKQDLRLEKQLFDRPLTDTEFSQLTPASTLAACLCIGVVKDLSRKPGDIVSAGGMLKGYSVEDRRIVGVIQHQDFAMIVYQRTGGWISMIEDDLNVLSCRKTQNGWRLTPSTNYYKILAISYQSPASNQAEQRDEPSSR